MQRRIVRSPDTEPLIRYDATMHDKPLFAPLKAPYFCAFESGIKTIEYRRCGAGDR